MKTSIWVLILPRLELPFLEEWLEHHLNLGFDTIYIYDNGFKSVELNLEIHDNVMVKGHGHSSGPVTGTDQWIRKLSEEERGVKWDKRPDADYNLHLSDDEIHNELFGIINKLRHKFGDDSIVYSKWRQGVEVSQEYPFSQALGYRHCVENNDSDWWITIDPDEYIILYKHKNIKEFIKDRVDNQGASPFEIRLTQRIFNERIIGKPVREVITWAYEMNFGKSLVRKPHIQTSWDCKFDTYEEMLLWRRTVTQDIHMTLSFLGANCESDPVFYETTKKAGWKEIVPNWYVFEKQNQFSEHTTRVYSPLLEWQDGLQNYVDENTARLYHYRGSPGKAGGQAHHNYIESAFTNIDVRMEKYFKDNDYDDKKAEKTWEKIHQPFELEYHKKPNYRWESFRNSWMWDDCWDKLFGSFMGFNKNEFSESQMILDVGCGSKPSLDWFTSGDKYYLDPLLNDYLKIKEVKKYWEDKPKKNLISEPAENLKSDLVNKFSFVLCWNVLDHTFDFKKIIKNISMYLKKDGVALIGNDIHKPAHIGHPGVKSEDYFFNEIEKYFKIEREEDSHSMDNILYRDACLKLSKK